MQDPNEIRLTFRSGGWVLLLLFAVIFAIIAWAVAPAVFRLGNQSAGDGTTIESYEFDLSNFSLSQETILPAMQHRDMSPVLNAPAIYGVEELAKSNNVQRKQFLVSKDLVVGIELGGEARAYPLHVLNVHEVVNDTLGGIPITVYWNWPSGHVAVFERTVDGALVNFGLSGLSGNGSMLLYIDAPEEGGEQLFSAIKSTSITGDLVPLKPITHEVSSWKSWIARHPETTALAPDGRYEKRYRKGDPRTYFLNKTMYFPVSPMPPSDINPKTFVLVLPTASGFTAYSIEELAKSANEQGVTTRMLEGKEIMIEVSNSPLYAIPRDSTGNVLQSQRALWFTWFANHPETVLYRE